MPAPLAKAALAALARINSRLNLKPTQQQQPGNSHSNATELATKAAGEISKQLQQVSGEWTQHKATTANTNGGGEQNMDIDESDKPDSGATSGPSPADGTAPSAGGAPSTGGAPASNAAQTTAGAPSGTAPAASGAPKPGAAPVIVQGSIPGLPVIPKGLPSLSAIKSSQAQAPPPNAQSKQRAENPPSAKVSAPEPLPSLPLPSPEAPAGETTLI